MVNSNANALGILFPNSYDSLVPDLVSERLMAPFLLPAVTVWWISSFPAWRTAELIIFP